MSEKLEHKLIGAKIVSVKGYDPEYNENVLEFIVEKDSKLYRLVPSREYLGAVISSYEVQK